MSEVLEFDTVILGGGPAGLSAGIYAARATGNIAIVDVSMFGGQPSNYLELENYPAFPIVGGYDLMEKMEEHADKFGVNKFPMEEIQKIDLISTPKIIETLTHTFKAKSVIIATGAQPKKLGVKGEKEFLGRGVSYCAICDGAFYRDKTVAVVGGGNAALEEAMYLTKFADKVFVIHRRNELRAGTHAFPGQAYRLKPVCGAGLPVHPPGTGEAGSDHGATVGGVLPEVP